MRRGMEDVKWVEKGDFQKKERKRRKGKEIQAYVIVRLSSLGGLKFKPRFLLEM